MSIAFQLHYGSACSLSFCNSRKRYLFDGDGELRIVKVLEIEDPHRNSTAFWSIVRCTEKADCAECRCTSDDMLKTAPAVPFCRLANNHNGSVVLEHLAKDNLCGCQHQHQTRSDCVGTRSATPLFGVAIKTGIM